MTTIEAKGAPIISTTTSRADRRFSWLTVEVALWMTIVIVAAGLRAYNLGWRLMQDSEAVQALSAWHFLQGEGAAAVNSPFLFTLNFFAFALFGGSEVAARLGPGLCGLALVILPVGLRQQLGRTGALVAGALLALSPTALFFSRFVDGGIAVAAGALAVAVGLFNYLEERRPGHLYLAAAGMAVALTAGPGGYTVLLVTGSFVLLAAFWGPSPWRERIRAAWQALRQDGAATGTAVAVLAGGFVLLSTTFLLHFPGLGQAADLLPAWLRAFVTAGGTPWYLHLQLLSLYEPLALVLGLGGVGYFLVARRSDTFLAFLAWWTALALVIYLLAGGRTTSDVLLLVLPLTLLAAAAIGRLLESACQEFAWDREGLFLAVAGGVAVYSYLEWTAYALTQKYDFFMLGLLALALMVVLTLLYFFWFGPVQTLRAVGLALAMILAVTTIAAGLHVTFPRSEDPREPLVGTPSTTGLRDLFKTMERASLFETGDPRGVEVTVDRAVGPVLLWYLRDWPAIHVVDRLDPSVTSPVVLSPAEDAPVVGEKYAGQDFIVQETWRLGNVSAVEGLRWIMFRRAASRPETRRVVLWVIARPEETEASSGDME